MMPIIFRFTAKATFAEGSARTTADDPDSLFAVDPNSAARKWLYRLAEADRCRCIEITVSA